MMRKKCKHGSISTFSDMVAVTLRGEESKEISQLVESWATFQASSVDCERGFILIVYIKKASRKCLKVEMQKWKRQTLSYCGDIYQGFFFFYLWILIIICLCYYIKYVNRKAKKNCEDKKNYRQIYRDFFHIIDFSKHFIVQHVNVLMWTINYV